MERKKIIIICLVLGLISVPIFFIGIYYTASKYYTPVADTYVRFGGAQIDHSEEYYIKVGELSSDTLESFISFNLNNLPSTINGGELNIFLDSVPATMNLNLILINEEWDQNTIDWWNKPQHVKIISTKALTQEAEDTYISFDISNELYNLNSISFCLNYTGTIQSSDYIVIGSTEWTSGISLIIRYETINPSLLSYLFFTGIIGTCVGLIIYRRKTFQKRTEEKASELTISLDKIEAAHFAIVPIAQTNLMKIIPIGEDIIISARFNARHQIYGGYEKWTTHGLITKNGFYFIAGNRVGYFDWFKLKASRKGIAARSHWFTIIFPSDMYNYPQFNELVLHWKEICKTLHIERTKFWFTQYSTKGDVKSAVKKYQRLVRRGEIQHIHTLTPTSSPQEINLQSNVIPQPNPPSEISEVPPQFTISEQTQICPVCGHSESELTKFCPQCGFDFTSYSLENESMDYEVEINDDSSTEGLENEEEPQIIEVEDSHVQANSLYSGSSSIEIILDEMPAPYPANSPEGKDAINFSFLARDRLATGKIDEAMKAMISALKLGVPEPTFSKFKEYLLKNYK